MIETERDGEKERLWKRKGESVRKRERRRESEREREKESRKGRKGARAHKRESYGVQHFGFECHEVNVLVVHWSVQTTFTSLVWLSWLRFVNYRDAMLVLHYCGIRYCCDTTIPIVILAVEIFFHAYECMEQSHPKELPFTGPLTRINFSASEIKYLLIGVQAKFIPK